MPHVKALFDIPLRDNDGRHLATETEDLRAELYIRFVGWTFLGYVKGVYLEVQRDVDVRFVR